ncbi:branched-chain-amino-acid transaminase [Aureococcus anophagefferens]|nr:branched-chain-amino-acid transaminase [Aureococcus anophagefferens]
MAAGSRPGRRSCDVSAAGAARRRSRRGLGAGVEVGSAGLDWARIGFHFQPTNGFVKFDWKDGRWDAGTFEPEPYLKMHVMSSAIHYGQGVYEGAKAHHCADGEVRLWNIDANAKRMTEGCARMMMPEVPEALFVKACEWAVAANLAYVPPYGSGGAMYIRPYIFGHGPQLGLSPAPTFSFCVLAIPVSPHAGGLKPIDVLVADGYDRAAPQGVGNVKASGNYGSDILVTLNARAEGYPTVLYLDAKEKKYVEEFSVSNFVGLKAGAGGQLTYVTPDTDSVLRSTTNDLLMELAASDDFGMAAAPPVPVEELDDFDEVAGCGTAVVMMGVKSITLKDKVYEYGSIDNVERLYDRYRAIQFGEAPDAFGWGSVVPPLPDAAA